MGSWNELAFRVLEQAGWVPGSVGGKVEGLDLLGLDPGSFRVQMVLGWSLILSPWRSMYACLWSDTEAP